MLDTASASAASLLVVGGTGDVSAVVAVAAGSIQECQMFWCVKNVFFLILFQR